MAGECPAPPALRRPEERRAKRVFHPEKGTGVGSGGAEIEPRLVPCLVLFLSVFLSLQGLSYPP